MMTEVPRYKLSHLQGLPYRPMGALGPDPVEDLHSVIRGMRMEFDNKLSLLMKSIEFLAALEIRRVEGGVRWL